MSAAVALVTRAHWCDRYYDFIMAEDAQNMQVSFTLMGDAAATFYVGKISHPDEVTAVWSSTDAAGAMRGDSLVWQDDIPGQLVRPVAGTWYITVVGVRSGTATVTVDAIPLVSAAAFHSLSCAVAAAVALLGLA